MVDEITIGDKESQAREWKVSMPICPLLLALWIYEWENRQSRKSAAVCGSSLIFFAPLLKSIRSSKSYIFAVRARKQETGEYLIEK